MKYFYDCEFLEDGSTIDLISIAIVAEDGREYYAVSDQIVTDSDLWERIKRSDWLMENVIPHIMHPQDFLLRYGGSGIPWKTRAELREEVEDFLSAASLPELWGWYSTYDHMALNQLWGKMMDKPSWLPWVTDDISSYARVFAVDALLPAPPQDQHHALADARWHRDMFIAMRRRVQGVHGFKIR